MAKEEEVIVKAPTSEDVAKQRKSEEDKILNAPEKYVLPEGDIIIIRELKAKDRPPLDKAYMEIVKTGYNLLKLQSDKATEKDTEEFMDAVTKDLETVNDIDIKLIMAGLKPYNPEFDEKKLLELTRTQMSELANQILSKNGIFDALKKILPPDLTQSLR